MKNAGAIEVSELRDLLERGERVTVLDVRRAEERAEWSIPGSVHRDAYDALRVGDVSALSDAALPQQAPVVVVCAMGRTSLIAARHLAERGFEAYSLTGGMKAWSLAWNVAELKAENVSLLQVRRTGKGCLSYVLASEAEAVVVDASLEPRIYAELAAAHGWEIRLVLDTHIHADHLSRSRGLAEMTGAALWLPEQQRARFPHRILRDGEELKFGRSRLRALHTPGHTLESTCYLVDDAWLLTGDTLFPSSVGRPDLEANADEARRRAVLLHGSLRRLFELDPGLLVLPCHTGDPVSFDQRVIGEFLGTVRNTIQLPSEADAFAERVLRRIPPTPPNHHTIVAHNEAGQLPDGDPTDLEAGANRCAIS